MHRLFTGAFSISRLATPLLAALLALAAPGAGLAQAPLARDIGSIRAVNRIPPGTRVRFPSGAEVPLGALLGHGQTTAVYAHGEEPDLAVRIPLLEKGYANSTWRGAELLEALAVPHATIREFSRDEYLLVDRVTPHPTIQLKHLFDPALSEAERGELREALREFARRLAPLQELGDFRLEQVVYGRAPDGKLGFRLLDWLAGARLAFLETPAGVSVATDSLVPRLLEAQIHLEGKRDHEGKMRLRRRLARDADPRWLEVYEELEALTRSERERLLATPGFTERLAALWRAQYPMGPLPERWRRSCLVDSAQALLGPGPAP